MKAPLSLIYAFVLLAFSATVRAQFPFETLRETKLSNVPGLNFSSDILALRGDTLLAHTNVYIRDGTNWVLDSTVPLGASITNLSGGYGDLSDDGQTVIIGAVNADGGKGAVFVFEKQGANWTRTATLTAADARAGANLGTSVAMAGDWIVAGAPQSSGSAERTAAYLFRRQNGTWTSAGKLMTQAPAAAYDAFGRRVAIDGDTIVVAAPEETNARGAVYVFARNQDNTWTQQSRLQIPLHPVYARLGLGRSVHLSGSVLAVGSEMAIYIYRRQNGAWVLEGDELKPADTTFGYVQVTAIKLNDSADTLVASDFQSGGQVGAAYLYELLDGKWIHTGTLEASDGGGGQFFGWQMDFSGETIAVKANVNAVYIYEPDYWNPATIDPFVRKHLYYEFADNSANFPKEKAAFRYKALLYAPDQQDPAKRVRAQIESIASLYGSAERERSQVAEARAHQAISAEPESNVYRDLILDIYYDRTGADALFLKDALAQADLARLGPPSTPGAFVIQDEIRGYQSALNLNRSALQHYFDLLQDDLGRPDLSPPLGYQIFQQRVPQRGLMPATYQDTNGTSRPVIATPGPLFTGYKDLVLIFDLLRTYGRTAATLARLQWARNEGDDRQAALRLLGDAQRFLQSQRDLLLGIFPSGLPAPGDPSGLAESIAAVEQSGGELAELQQLLRGNQNILGFDPEFLMLVQKFQGQNPELFDSFNSFKEWLDPAFTSRQLGYALQRLNTARASYSTFRGNQDEMREQLEGSTVTYDFRLYEIVGANRGEPAYETPGSIPGSEMWQQIESIKAAQLAIRRNHTNIANLWAQIQIEINKANDLKDAYIRHGNVQAELTQYIGHINAVQAASQALVDAFSIEKLTTGLVFAHTANAVAQGGGEELKGQVEADKERLAGLHQAEVVGIESRAIVKTLLLDMHTLALDSEAAAIQFNQEVGRLAALHREKAYLERRIAERNTDLASRYFADPAHRIQTLHDTLEANWAFEEAQKWTFFMARALDYKWNVPFVHASGGKTWRTDTVFKLRNAEELNSMYQAMVNYDGGIEGTRSKDDYFDWFSVREDFLGFRRVNDQGELLYYRDSETGEELTAIEAFRRHLIRHQDALGQIRLEFSTVREIPGGTFFQGADLLPNGAVDPDQRGLYLDKIRWMKIRLPGWHNPNRNRTFIRGSLTYAGNSYIRNEAPGRRDPARPDQIVDEWTPYSTRYWFQATTRVNRPPSWQFREALTDPAVQMWLTNDPRQNGSPTQIDVLPSVQQIDAFKERSVAATNWRLILPTRDQTSTLLDINELNDIEIYFYHYAVIRP